MRVQFSFKSDRTVSSHASKRDHFQFRHVPEIKLQGIYLEKAGFKIGEKVAVDVVKDQIIIRRGGQNGSH
ncbi:MAG: SymE family type I addiction module toxin [Cyclobacteriaceae bacterium]